MAAIYLHDEVSERAAAIAMIKGVSVQELVAEALEKDFQGMDERDRELVQSILRSRSDHANARRTNIVPPPASGQGAVRYESTRLTFRRDAISTLAPEGLLVIGTPQGTFEMTRAAFEADFANVLSSDSYSRQGVYHYPVVPEKAKKYLK